MEVAFVVELILCGNKEKIEKRQPTDIGDRDLFCLA